MLFIYEFVSYLCEVIIWKLVIYKEKIKNKLKLFVIDVVFKFLCREGEVIEKYWLIFVIGEWVFRK